MPYHILSINPGSTSTKIAVYIDEDLVFEKNIDHPREALYACKSLVESLALRRNEIEGALQEFGVARDSIDVVIGRGGMLCPIPGGTYRVSARMLDDLVTQRYGEHASNLGAQLASELANEIGVPALIADPVVTDEMSDLARLSGHPKIERRSIFHALNQKAVARDYCKRAGVRYEEVNLIVAHIGGGLSVGAHEKGRVADVNDAVCGDGPYSTQRTGGLPVKAVIRLSREETMPDAELIRLLNSQGGLVGYLGTDNGREIGSRVRNGDAYARLIYEGMAYQTAKEIGACAAALKGDVYAILLTGGHVYDEMFSGWIIERTKFIAPVIRMPGGDEQRALCSAALRVLRGEEQAKEY
jgi:butyrate kinase